MSSVILKIHYFLTRALNYSKNSFLYNCVSCEAHILFFAQDIDGVTGTNGNSNKR